MTELLTPAQIKSRLSFKIAERVVRQKMRSSGLAIEHRRQLRLDERYWLEFLDFLRCSSSNAVASKASGKSLAPSEEKSFEKALALLAGNTPKRSSRSASAKS
jgi:hypothetical protein